MPMERYPIEVSLKVIEVAARLAVSIEGRTTIEERLEDFRKAAEYLIGRIDVGE